MNFDEKLKVLDFIEESLRNPHELKCSPYICTIFASYFDTDLTKKFLLTEIKGLFPELDAAIERKKKENVQYTEFDPIWPREFTGLRIKLIQEVRKDLLDDGLPF